MRMFIDCAGGRSVIALARKSFYAEHGLGFGKEAEGVMPAARGLLSLAGAGFGDIEEICVYTGPGSFTGIRIAMAAALGIARATGAALYGMDGFSRLAAQSRANAPAVIFIGSGRGQAYVAHVDEKYIASDAQAVSQDEACSYLRAQRGANTAVIADARAADFTRACGIGARILTPSSAAAPHLFARMKEAGKWAESPEFAPVYARPPDAKPQAPFAPGGHLLYGAQA